VSTSDASRGGGSVVEVAALAALLGSAAAGVSLAKRRVSPVPSESAAYRALLWAGMIDPGVHCR
jgi:hypothetical protein